MVEATVVAGPWRKKREERNGRKEGIRKYWR
jgi:hypothetical protein